MNKESTKFQKVKIIHLFSYPPHILSQEYAPFPSSTFHGHLFILKRRLPTDLKFLAHKMIETVSTEHLKFTFAR